jgi:hypothetical protein
MMSKVSYDFTFFPELNARKERSVKSRLRFQIVNFLSEQAVSQKLFAAQTFSSEVKK